MGRVVDAQTGRPISGALVLARFRGERPLVNLPVGPHPAHRTGACMGSAIAQTGATGLFVVDEFVLNRALAGRSVFLLVMKPGWVATRASARTGGSLVSFPSFTKFSMREGPGARRDTRSHTPGSPELSLLPHELTSSEELFEVLQIASLEPCDDAGLRFSVIAMEYALEVASTFDERWRTRSACGLARASIAKINGGSLRRDSGFGRFKKELSWPFNCEELHFKHSPSPEVLSVEAVLFPRRDVPASYPEQRNELP